MARIVLGEAHADRAVPVQVGDEIELRLPESPTTGYRWSVQRPAEMALDYQGTRFEPAPGSGVGGGGTRFFTFKVGREEPAELELALARPWERDAAPRRVYRVSLTPTG